MLGFKVGGIVGHKFLRRYRVAIDLERIDALRFSRSLAWCRVDREILRFSAVACAARGLPRHTRCSSSVSTSSGGIPPGARRPVDCHERQERAAVS